MICLLDWIEVCIIAEYITWLKYVSIFPQLVRRSFPFYNVLSICLLSSVIISPYLFSNTLLLVLRAIPDNTPRFKMSTSIFLFPCLSIVSVIFQSLYTSSPEKNEAYLQYELLWKWGCSAGSFYSTHSIFIVYTKDSHQHEILLTDLQTTPRNGSQWIW